MSQTCLQTAERVLPAVFALLEAAVEVLAADADRGASTSIDDEEAPQLPASCACLKPPRFIRWIYARPAASDCIQILPFPGTSFECMSDRG